MGRGQGRTRQHILITPTPCRKLRLTRGDGCGVASGPSPPGGELAATSKLINGDGRDQNDTHEYILRQGVHVDHDESVVYDRKQESTERTATDTADTTE